MSEMGPLDLGGADLKGFDPIDAGRYNAEIFEMTWDATKKDGKTPKGTPMLKIQFKVFEPKIDGEVLDQDRRLFTQYVKPPVGYDAKKAATMKGMIARFFIAAGDDEAYVTGPDFSPDFEDYKGREVVLSVSKYEYPEGSGEYRNSVTGVKPAGSLAETSSGGLL